MHAQKVIERLGYSPSEAKVYLCALALGEAHVSDIAARAKLPRTSVQAIAEKLHKDGLMNFYVQRRYKYWVAEDPKRFLATLKRREAALAEALPALTKLRNSKRKKGKGADDTDAAFDVFRMLANATPQAVLIVDDRTEIAYVNRAWERLFGYELHEVRGKHPRMFQSGETPPAVFDRMAEALRAGKLFHSEEIVDRKKDGTPFTLRTSVFPVERDGRRYYIQILDDISEQKRVDELRKEFTKAFFTRE